MNKDTFADLKMSGRHMKRPKTSEVTPPSAVDAGISATHPVHEQKSSLSLGGALVKVEPILGTDATSTMETVTVRLPELEPGSMDEFVYSNRKSNHMSSPMCADTTTSGQHHSDEASKSLVSKSKVKITNRTREKLLDTAGVKVSADGSGVASASAQRSQGSASNGGSKSRSKSNKSSLPYPTAALFAAAASQQLRAVCTDISPSLDILQPGFSAFQRALQSECTMMAAVLYADGSTSLRSMTYVVSSSFGYCAFVNS